MTRILTIIALLFTTPALSHGGRTNAEGCHNERATGGYHCHNRTSEGTSSVKRIKRNEDFYNKLLASSLNARAENKYNYRWDNGNSFIRVDVETDEFVIEGGLDKRSSLDSVQQALFAAQLTGKKPVVVIYDTDGEEGRFEFRVKIAAEAAGVKYFNLSEKNILDFKGLK
jgi:hypothetical protein